MLLPYNKNRTNVLVLNQQHMNPPYAPELTGQPNTLFSVIAFPFTGNILLLFLIGKVNIMVKTIYHCDKCDKRLFDLISDEGLIEIKCQSCKEIVKVNLTQLYRYAVLYQKIENNDISKEVLTTCRE